MRVYICTAEWRRKPMRGVRMEKIVYGEVMPILL